MKIRKLFAYALPALIALASTGCNQGLEDGPKKQGDEVVFTVTVTEVTGETAKASISHTGSDRDTYVAFSIDDKTTPVNQLINQKIQELQSSKTLASALKSGSIRTDVLTGLKPLTDYRYIVFGITADGNTYGESGVADFTTVKGSAVFTIEPDGAPTHNSASFSVTSTGDQTDTWYAFCTNDLDTPLSEIAQTEAAKASASDLKHGNATVTFTNLEPSTTYRAIVVGVKDGVIYGNPVSYNFTTTIAVEENPNWTVTYEGSGTLDYGSGPQAYKQIISVEVTGGTDYYFIDMVSTANLAEYYDNNYPAFFEDEIAYLSQALAQYNMTWSQFANTKSAYEGFNQRVPGTYIAFAVGVTANGQFSGKYAKCEAFEIIEEEASETYTAWLGQWNLNPFTLSISHKINNYAFEITGWEGIDLPFEALYDEESGSLILYAQSLGELPFDDGNGGAEYLPIWFYAINTDGYIITGTEYAISYATLNSDNRTANLSQEGVKLSDGSTTQLKTAKFIGKDGEDFFTFTELAGQTPTFPTTMTKVSDQTAAAGTKASSIKLNRMSMIERHIEANGTLKTMSRLPMMHR